MSTPSSASRSLLYSGSKIVAIAKNYAKHKVEMGGSASRLEEPAIFLKPSSSVIAPGASIVRPAACLDLHHEVELGVVIGKRCRKLSSTDWRSVVGGYCLGLDMTARDLQAKAKASGMPWTVAKGYDTFTPLSHIIDASRVPDPHALELYLSVDGKERQRGTTGDMLHKIPELLVFISGVMTLEAGDVILTGTPEGVAAVAPGQVIKAGITGLLEVEFPVTS